MSQHGGTKTDHARSEDSMDMSNGPSYARFGAMIGTSTAVMFILTYTNVISVGHIHWSQERFYMALLMGAAMAIVMLGFMWKMYRSGSINVAIVAGGLALFSLGFFLSQSQTFIGDERYMKGMIPHHSIAILTSTRADIDDVRVRELAEQITDAQRREIAEMEWLLEDIERNGLARTAAEAASRPVPEFAPTP